MKTIHSFLLVFVMLFLFNSCANTKENKEENKEQNEHPKIVNIINRLVEKIERGKNT